LATLNVAALFSSAREAALTTAPLPRDLLGVGCSPIDRPRQALP
jgi:hypothetical protein